MPDDEKAELRSAYVDLLAKCLTFALWDTKDLVDEPTAASRSAQVVGRLLSRLGVDVGQNRRGILLNELGLKCPRIAHSMIGLERMNHLRRCVEDVIQAEIPGDLIETGVWRGGAAIFMRGMLRAHGITDRRVWVADSFAGLPVPDAIQYPADAGDPHHTFDVLSASLESVKANFETYGLLDAQVGFLEGWFKDTLPKAPIDRLALAHLDGDMYESTIDALRHLYPKLSIGGYLIVDDYGAIPACRQALEDYRDANRINEPMAKIAGGCVYWKRAR